MPPVEIFVGLDALRSSAETVPGLPSKEELEKWIKEHDEIEKDTEIFDSGELKNLRNFTKGTCTKRTPISNSPLIFLLTIV